MLCTMTHGLPVCSVHNPCLWAKHEICVTPQAMCVVWHTIHTDCNYQTCNKSEQIHRIQIKLLFIIFFLLLQTRHYLVHSTAGLAHSAADSTRPLRTQLQSLFLLLRPKTLRLLLYASLSFRLHQLVHFLSYFAT